GGSSRWVVNPCRGKFVGGPDRDDTCRLWHSPASYSGTATIFLGRHEPARARSSFVCSYQESAVDDHGTLIRRPFSPSNGSSGSIVSGYRSTPAATVSVGAQ